MGNGREKKDKSPLNSELRQINEGGKKKKEMPTL